MVGGWKGDWKEGDVWNRDGGAELVVLNIGGGRRGTYSFLGAEGRVCGDVAGHGDGHSRGVEAESTRSAREHDRVWQSITEYDRV